MRIAKNFHLHELIDDQTYKRFDAFSRHFLDETAVQVLQDLRSMFGPCTVNNWRAGGDFKYSGFRPYDCSIGGKYSQHKFGRAFDCKFSKATADEVREAIMADEESWVRRGLTRLEDGEFAKTWVHFDVAWTGQDNIVIVKP